MIIPIFIPHEGCPNDCAFCNQRTISGKSRAPQTDEVKRIIEEHLKTMDAKAEQIAFFGGSFTGITAEKQNMYLSVAYEYIKNGKADSIRLSTRPDYIDTETVKRLMAYGVKNIELGAQSMDEEVLRLSNRGHSPIDVEKASEIIKNEGAVLGLQMMTGLPGDSAEKCMYTARRFKDLGAEETRIYPTVILEGTALAKMYRNGEYTAHTTEEAVDICSKLYRFFCDNNIKILRMGLPDSDELRENYIAGAFHPSLGEMIISRDIRNFIEAHIGDKEIITVRANKSYISKIKGNKKCNINYFASKNVTLEIAEDNTAKDYYITEES